jgi:hypothetical protein
MPNKIKIIQETNLQKLEDSVNNYLKSIGNSAIYGTPQLLESQESYTMFICHYVPVEPLEKEVD